MATVQTISSIDARALDDCLGRLSARKDAWVRLSAADRVPFLRSAIDGVLDVADEWVGSRATPSRSPPGRGLPAKTG